VLLALWGSDGTSLHEGARDFFVHPLRIWVLELVEEFQDSPAAHLVVGKSHRGQARPQAVGDELEVVMVM